MLLNHRRALAMVGVMLAATAVLFALVAFDATRSRVQVVDDTFLRWMVDIRWSPLTAVAKVMAVLGSPWVNWPLRIAALALLARRRRWLQLAAFSLAIATSEACIGPVKALYGRARPPHPLMATSGAAFPSGHAIAGAVTAVGLVVVLLPPGPARWRWEVRAAAFACLMAVSRIYLAAHWLSDVVAGGLLGTSLAIGWPALLQELRDRRRLAETRRRAESSGRETGR